MLYDHTRVNGIRTLNYHNPNAFWSGSAMAYGDGDTSLGYLPFTAIDITGHKITHGLTEFTAELICINESGAFWICRLIEILVTALSM
jgi:Zn-dependent metalloprotease